MLTLYQNDRILDRSKFKAFAEDKMNMTENLKIVLERIGNIVGKGENARDQHFLLFPQCFPEFFYWVVKSRYCLVMS